MRPASIAHPEPCGCRSARFGGASEELLRPSHRWPIAVLIYIQVEHVLEGGLSFVEVGLTVAEEARLPTFTKLFALLIAL
jgi:hypothetical protein